MNVSALQKARADYQPKLPQVLVDSGPAVRILEGEPTRSVADQEGIRKRFPHTYGMPILTFEPGGTAPAQPIKAGVILSGGQAPGGHNVIAGLYDGLKRLHSASQLYGFLGGPGGLIDNHYQVLDDDLIDEYRNTGGFDIIGSGRKKLETVEDFKKVVQHCTALGISALVVIGGDDSNTNACVLAEYCLDQGAGIQIIGCPKTIDGDLKNEWVECSFGFDTATKLYGELIGNVLRDANSAKKYWHFIKLMGRSASHITLECALRTQPNIALISEEIEAEKKTLQQIAEEIAEVVRGRAEKGKLFGVALVPEGLVEFVPEMKVLIAELNDLLAEHKKYFESLDSDQERRQFVNRSLSAAASQTFSSLPRSIQMQLLAERDPHGNVQVSRIETESLLIDLVGDILAEWKAEDKFPYSFGTQSHFFGYEGRCAAPSNFDADYCYSLGYTAAALAGGGKTGYLASVRRLTRPADQWIAGGIPLTMMMNLERRHGQEKPVIRKAMVDLDGAPFREFAAQREAWAMDDAYLYPGPIQYFGPSEVCELTTETIRLEQA